MLLLSSHLADSEVEQITEYVRNTFFRSCAAEGKLLLHGLIKYAEYNRRNPRQWSGFSEDEINQAENARIQFVESLAVDVTGVLDINDIDFIKYDEQILIRAFLILPYYICDEIFKDLLFRFVKLILEELNKQEGNSFISRRNERLISHSGLISVRKYLTELFIYLDIDQSNNLLTFLLDVFYSRRIKKETFGRHDILDFLSGVFENMIYQLDILTTNTSDETESQVFINNFWKVWELLYAKVKSSGQDHFYQILFLGIHWKDDSTYWKPLEKGKGFYSKMIEENGGKALGAIIGVFSTCGEKTFLPHGITLICNLIRQADDDVGYLAGPSEERLIKRLFYNHISVIKRQKVLIDEYIFLLNVMIDQGSSNAYLFRENVITYKR
jgi:hypothetical protein